jgi:hypothetical protein
LSSGGRVLSTIVGFQRGRNEGFARINSWRQMGIIDFAPLASVEHLLLLADLVLFSDLYQLVF